jgi:hypothetical protein
MPSDNIVYARKLNSAQRALLLRYVSITGLAPMYQEDLDSGELTFSQMWALNVDHVWSIHCELVNLDKSGTGA